MAKKITIGMQQADRDWETEDAFRTLCRAEEIRKDKKLMSKVQAFAQEQMKRTASVMAEAGETE